MTTRPVSGARVGGLEQRVRIENPVVTTNASGEALVTHWELFSPAWAEIIPLSGKEWLASAEYRPGVQNRIRIRWIDGVNASMRVVWGTRIYAIEAVLLKPKGKKEIWLMCSDGLITEGGQA